MLCPYCKFSKVSQGSFFFFHLWFSGLGQGGCALSCFAECSHFSIPWASSWVTSWLTAGWVSVDLIKPSSWEELLQDFCSIYRRLWLFCIVQPFLEAANPLSPHHELRNRLAIVTQHTEQGRIYILMKWLFFSNKLGN